MIIKGIDLCRFNSRGPDSKMKDTSLKIDNICGRDFGGSSSSMHSSGLLFLIKDMYWKLNGKFMLGTIVIDDDIYMKNNMPHPYTLPRGHKNKGGVVPKQIEGQSSFVILTIVPNALVEWYLN